MADATPAISGKKMVNPEAAKDAKPQSAKKDKPMTQEEVEKLMEELAAERERAAAAEAELDEANKRLRSASIHGVVSKPKVERARFPGVKGRGPNAKLTRY